MRAATAMENSEPRSHNRVCVNPVSRISPGGTSDNPVPRRSDTAPLPSSRERRRKAAARQTRAVVQYPPFGRTSHPVRCARRPLAKKDQQTARRQQYHESAGALAARRVTLSGGRPTPCASSAPNASRLRSDTRVPARSARACQRGKGGGAASGETQGWAGRATV